MNLEQLIKARKHARKIGALFFIFIFVCLLDACVANLREPMHVYNVLPGQTVGVNGPVDPKIKHASELAQTSPSDKVMLAIEETKSGYFLGGNMWTGTVTVTKDAPPGAYDIAVFPKGETDPKKHFVFRAVVHKDYASLRGSFVSIIQRNTGVAPWLAALFCLLSAGLTMAAVFLMSKKIEALLATQGKAEIYRIVHGDNVNEIAFGLGSRHGLQPEARVVLLDAEGRQRGTAVVKKVFEGDSLAFVGLEVPVKDGDIVSLR
ncbi:MAG: hypothetical protein FD164_1654 [Nitrospirae bacterium]|nr:MAG: hypothetical protein FD164_1654 [Nitrospirota bacterium]